MLTLDMKSTLLLLTAAVVVGCRVGDTPRALEADAEPVAGTRSSAGRVPSWRTASMFEFLQVGLPSSVMTNAIGIGTPDRQLGSGQLRWEYDLWDGSDMVIFLNWDTNRSVAYWGERRGTNWLWLKPEGYR
jgi:hypothetical protein